jgi:hypothetical protein
MIQIIFRGILRYPRYSTTIDAIVELMGTTSITEFNTWIIISIYIVIYFLE